MTVTRIVMLAFLLLALEGCKEKPPAQSLADVYEEGGSVYDQGAGADATASDDLQSDEIRSDGFSPTFNDDDIESISTLDDVNGSLEGRGRPDLDWSPIFFSFDESSLSDEARGRLRLYAETLMNNPNLRVMLEGHCDIRGTEDYNLALGERRAQAVKRYLMELGVPDQRLKTMSYGEMRPLIPGESETAWTKNRRVSFTF